MDFQTTEHWILVKVKTFGQWNTVDGNWVTRAIVEESHDSCAIKVGDEVLIDPRSQLFSVERNTYAARTIDVIAFQPGIPTFKTNGIQ